MSLTSLGWRFKGKAVDRIDGSRGSDEMMEKGRMRNEHLLGQQCHKTGDVLGCLYLRVH